MKVELLNYMGNDSFIADTARVSYLKEASNYTKEQNTKLINYLASHNHWSPFSHAILRFRLEIPIYCERQLIKTQSGVTYNSVSGRYVDFSDTYTEIKQFRKQSKDSKQGSAEDLEELDNQLALIEQQYIIEKCKESYNKLRNMGISLEQCRTILPLCLNTTMIWTGSLYAFIRLCKQRLKPEAQAETQLVVREMLDAVLNIEEEPFKESLLAWNLK